MDYTKSQDYATHAATGQRMHEDNQAAPTVVSDDDLNMVIWSLVALIKGAGLTPVQFNRDVASTYELVLSAVRAIALASPALQGTPSAPTPAALSNTQQIINAAFLWSATNGQRGVDVTTAGAYTLTDTDANNRVLYFFGTPTASSTVVFPTTQQRDYLLINLTTIDQFVKLSGQTDYVTIPAGRRKIIYCTSAKVNDFFTNVQLDGVNTAPTALASVRTQQLSTCEFTHNAIDLDRPFEAVATNIKANGTQSVGTLNTVARADHIHPTDTSRVAKSGDTMTGVLKVKSGTGLAAGVKGDEDGDTGFEWLSDGILQCIVNNKARAEFNEIGDYTKITNNSGQFAVFQNDGNFVVKSADSSIVWDAFGVSQKYVSGDLVMTNGGQIVVNHGLGAEPMHISLHMRCVAADMGYAVGDVIRIAGNSDPSESNESLGVLVNNTQIIVRVGYNGPQLIAHKANGTGGVATTANWRLIIKASK